MRILIIGGTRFVGRHPVEAALARNHEVTLFNRGRSNPDLFPQVETIRDTLAWATTRPADHEWRAGLRPEREQELLTLLNT